MGKRSEQLSRGGNFFIFIFEAKGNVGPVGVGGPRGTVRGLGRGFEVTMELLGFVGESLLFLWPDGVGWGRCHPPGLRSSCGAVEGALCQGAGKGLWEEGDWAP